MNPFMVIGNVFVLLSELIEVEPNTKLDCVTFVPFTVTSILS